MFASPRQHFGQQPPSADGLGADAPEGEFDTMFVGARASAIRWAQKAKAEVREEAARLESERRAFEEDMARLRREFCEQRQEAYDQIREDRCRAQRELEETVRRARDERRGAPAHFAEQRNHHHSLQHRERWRLRLAREKHLAQAKAREVELRRILEHNATAGAVVDINVGGTVFAAPRHTLAQQPGSLLGQWLSGRASAPTDRHGCIYLDRDPVLFRTLLNFLRSPEAPPPTRDAAESEEVCREAAFYGLRLFPFPLVYAVGGHDGAGHLATVELLDVESRRWRSCRPMQVERASFGAAALHSRLHAFGGRNGEYQALRETECLDCLRGEWVPGVELDRPRRNCASAQDGQRVYVSGGFDGQQLLDSVEVLDPRMRKWQQIRPMSTPRASAASVVLGGRLWVLGGTNGSRLRSVEAYDLRAGRWEQLPAGMCEARSAGQAGACLGRLYAFGGIGERHDVHRSMECLGHNAPGSWTMLSSMREPRMDFGCCSLEDMIMVSGGQHGQVSSTSEFYKPELDEWQFGPPMLSPRYGHQLLFANI